MHRILRVEDHPRTAFQACVAADGMAAVTECRSALATMFRAGYQWMGERHED